MQFLNKRDEFKAYVFNLRRFIICLHIHKEFIKSFSTKPEVSPGLL